MDYEKKYKEALEKARQLCAYPTTKPFISDLQDIFPELKESEDERIREELIKSFNEYLKQSEAAWSKDVKFKYVNVKDAIAWLEKQDEPTSIPADAVLDSNKDGLIADTVRYKREKQGDDKVESKFKVGDIIINGKIIGKVDENENNKYHGWFGYDKDLNVHYADIPDVENWHLWTIQDAKDGDVLVSNDASFIVLFKGLSYLEDDIYRFKSYCYYREGIFSPIEDPGWCCNAFHPATKEQREQLEKAMADAGYTFDVEKKELKKIEQKSVEWSEEDEKMLSDIIKDLVHPWNEYIPDRIEDEITWLKNKLKFLRPQSQWRPSEEHIHWLIWVINRMPNTEKANEAEAVLRDLLEQLNKLRKE